MAGVSPDLLWQLVKKNNKFLVKRNGDSSASVQFSCEPNNLYSLNTFKYSGLANKKTVSITPGSELSVFLGTTKTKKGCKPKEAVNISLLKRDVRRMATVVVNQSQEKPALHPGLPQYNCFHELKRIYSLDI